MGGGNPSIMYNTILSWTNSEDSRTESTGDTSKNLFDLLFGCLLVPNGPTWICTSFLTGVNWSVQSYSAPAWIFSYSKQSPRYPYGVSQSCASNIADVTPSILCLVREQGLGCSVFPHCRKLCADPGPNPLLVPTSPALKCTLPPPSYSPTPTPSPYASHTNNPC